jgi:nicotinate-nucleotide pyrophosphorylase (carboxylating)
MDDIDRFLDEDLGSAGDITSDSLFSNEKAVAKIISQEDCIVAGLEEAKKIYGRLGVEFNNKVLDGNFIKKQTIISEIKGKAGAILKGERLILNILGRMSGIATETRKLMDICKPINPKLSIAGTRKTTPGFRYYEKKAIEIGGGDPHRFGLYDEVMIKDNHIKLVGSVKEAIEKVKGKVHDKIIEVEVENEKDALTAAKLGVNFIMLDNFNPKSAESIAKKVKEVNPDVLIEISGGVNPDNIKNYASFADRISLGYLTHSIKNKDFSLEIT